MKTPIENKALVATRNINRFVQANSHHVSIPAHPRYKLDNESQFTISFILTNCTDGLVFQWTHADGTNVYMGRTSDTGVTFVYDAPALTLITIALSGLPSLSISSVRLTLVKYQTGIRAYVNNRVAGVQDVGGLGDGIDFSRSPLILGKQQSGIYTNGAVSNFLILAKAISFSELTELHRNNVIPASAHINVIAHFPLNETGGSKAYDAVAQYNYSKRTPFKGSTALTTANFTLSATGGAAGTMANGSDGDGSYVEFEMTNYVAAQTLYWELGPTLETIGSVTPYNFTVKFKLIGTSRIALATSLGGTTQGHIGFDSAVVGNGIITWTYSGVTSLIGSPFRVSFITGVTSPLVNSKVRIYSVDMTGINSPNHGDLINYTNDETGVTNPLLQRAWHDLYEAKKKGQFYLTFNPATPGYGIVPSFGLTTSAWTMYFNILAPVEPLTFTKSIFFNQTSAFDTSNYVRLFWEAGNQLYIYFGSNSPGIRTYVPGRQYRILILGDSTRSDVYINDGLTITTVSFAQRVSVFQAFTLGYDTLWGLVAAGGYGRVLFASRVITDREKDLLYAGGSINNTVFDIDLGDVFLNTNYYARDNSGNSRHLLLNSYVPAVDQPILREQESGVAVRKALRLVRANSHYLSIANFVPTKEKGYTYIIGFALDTDRNFNDNTGTSGGEFFLTKQNGSYTVIKQMSGTYNTKIMGLGDPNAIGITLKGALSKLQYIAFTENTSGRKAFPFGFFNNSDAQPLEKGWNEIPDNLDFRIGSFDAPGNNSLNGYLLFVGIWKGILPIQIMLDVIAGKPFMTDCQLYLNFDAVLKPVLYFVKNFTSGWADSLGTSIITYGSDGDGAYVEIETTSTLPTIVSAPVGAVNNVVGRVYTATFVIKVKTATYYGLCRVVGNPGAEVNTGTSYGDALDVLSTKSFDYTASSTAFLGGAIVLQGASAAGQKLRVYSIAVEEKMKRIKDWSPQDHRVELKNYSDNETNPAHADYRIIDPNTLR